MHGITTNATILTFVLQFYKLISNINRYERVLQKCRGCEIYTVINHDDGYYKYEVTQELIDTLKHSAFERYSSLRVLGAKDILESFLEQQKNQDHDGDSNDKVVRRHTSKKRSHRIEH
jgi:hypothetical protein